MGVSVVIAGVSGDARRDVVMRLPRSEAGYRSASTNGAALRDLAGSAFSDYAPALLASGTWRGQDYFIEQKLPGREIAFHGARADQMIRQACVAVAGMQAADACVARVDEALFERLIGHHLDELGGFCKGRSSELLARVDAALRRQLIGQRLLVVRKHGDFKLGNILYDEHGQLSALIDWDGSMAEGMPLADYFTLITYRHKEERGYDNFLALNSRVAVDWEVRDFYRGLIDEVAQILRLPAELVPALRCAACLISIQLRLDWTVKSDERWVAEFAEVLLEDMCRLLEGQSGAA
jgi:aminoglycoside phosphotransferase (APT) family kinase protein